MSQADLSRLIASWCAGDERLAQDEIDRRILAFTAIARAISEKGVASREEFAATTGLPLEQVSDLFQRLAVSGIEFDDAGNVIGAALTTRPTPHRFHVRDRDLYAWCALDTLFLPGLLDETAEVRSTCPVSGDEIRLTVTPERVASYQPRSTALSIVVPTELASDQGTGPASPT